MACVEDAKSQEYSSDALYLEALIFETINLLKMNCSAAWKLADFSVRYIYIFLQVLNQLASLFPRNVILYWQDEV